MRKQVNYYKKERKERIKSVDKVIYSRFQFTTASNLSSNYLTTTNYTNYL
jgi:hypothetical protein